MPFWNPFRKSTLDYAACKSYEPLLRLATDARLELAQQVPPRTNHLVGDLLAHVWGDDPIDLLLVRTALVRPARDKYTTLENGKFTTLHSDLLKIAATPPASVASLTETHFMKELQAFIRQHTPRCPDYCPARYDAVIAGLRACLYHNMQELRQTDETFSLNYLFDGLTIASNLCAYDLRDVYCDMLITAHQVIVAEHDGPRIAPLERLRHELRGLLLWPPFHSSVMWQRLKDPTISEHFWPVVDMIGNSPIDFIFVPQLLDALPVLSDGGKAHVINALSQIGHASTLPALQQLAQDKTSAVAPLALKAVLSILSHSASDAAQLLRAADSQQTAPSSETLLRPAAEGSSSVRPEELLRPDLTPGPSPDRATR